MEEFYKNIGDTLRKTILELMLGLLQERTLKFVGLKPSRKIKLCNSIELDW
jgi:hypothetical protein